MSESQRSPTPAHEALRTAEHVLLDFDGPVCAVFGTVTDAAVADALRARLTEHGHTLTEELRSATDPFDMLPYAAQVNPDLAAAVEAEFCRWERHAALQVDPEPGIRDVLAWLADTGRTVTIVSNNATTAIETYLHATNLDAFVAGVSARQPDDIGWLKPHPHLLQQAIAARGTTPDRCVMIGDSASDIQAATTVGTPTVAYANQPGKDDKLAAHAPRAIIHHLRELLPADPSAVGRSR